MWFYRLISFCLFFSLVGCGFHPLYTPYNGRHNTSYPIKIAVIADRDGQILRNSLVDLLTPEGAPPHPRYFLDVNLTKTISSTAINKDESTNRKQALLTAIFTLKDMKTNKILYQHTATAINSFSVISQNYYSDLTAQQYAVREAAQLLAENISLLITTYLNSCNED